MAYTKTFSTNKSPTALYKEWLNSCSLADIQVLDSTNTDSDFKIQGKKTYPTQIRFRWGVVTGLFFLGVILAAAQKGVMPAESTELFVIIPALIYVVYYFVKAQATTVNFDFRGRAQTDGSLATAILSKDFDMAKSEINQMIVRFL